MIQRFYFLITLCILVLFPSLTEAQQLPKQFVRNITAKDYLLVKQMIEENPSIVSQVDKKGKSGLIYASEIGDFAIVQYLVDSGSDILIKDLSGLSAIDYSKKGKYEEIYKYLEKVSYNKIKASKSIDQFAVFLDENTSHSYCDSIRYFLDRLCWEKIVQDSVMDYCIQYISYLPEGQHIDDVKKIQSSKELNFYYQIVTNLDMEGCQAFLETFPNSDKITNVNRLYEGLRFIIAKKQNTYKAYDSFLQEFPVSEYSDFAHLGYLMADDKYVTPLSTRMKREYWSKKKLKSLFLKAENSDNYQQSLWLVDNFGYYIPMDIRNDSSGDQRDRAIDPDRDSPIFSKKDTSFNFSQFIYSPYGDIEDIVDDSVKIIIIRSGKFVGAANVWQIFLNEKPLCQLHAGRYFETTIHTDHLLVQGKLIGPGAASLMTIGDNLLLGLEVFPLKKTTYYISTPAMFENSKVSSGGKGNAITLILIDPDDAKEKMEKLKRQDN